MKNQTQSPRFVHDYPLIGNNTDLARVKTSTQGYFRFITDVRIRTLSLKNIQFEKLHAKAIVTKIFTEY